MKIITGSLSGVLRIHKPTANGYKVEDELLETNLGEPILQIVVGNFVQQNDRPALAVLFPRRLAVYTVNAVLAQSGNVSYLQLSMAHEHSLDRTAANMTHGAFGGATRFESIAVQSMDGQISFYENETLSFTRYLPNFLLPGPLAYDPVTDGIITCNSALQPHQARRARRVQRLRRRRRRSPRETLRYPARTPLRPRSASPLTGP